MVVASVALLFAVTGCGASAQDQSKAAACDALQRSVSAATSELSASMTDTTSDPAKAVTRIEAVATSFDKGLGAITNPEVKKVGATADAALTAMVAQFTSMLADPAKADTVTLQATLDAVESDFTAVGAVCPD